MATDKRSASKANGLADKVAALALIEDDRRNRATAAAKAVERVLLEYNCRLGAAVIIKQGQINTQIEIQAND